jgi:hypothetical protein
MKLPAVFIVQNTKNVSTGYAHYFLAIAFSADW